MSCPYCGGDIGSINPTGNCDHTYYPDNVNKGLKKVTKESNVTFEIDFENDDILINSDIEDRLHVNRLLVIHAWVLLYCLDPERFKDGSPTMVFCQQVMAHNPPIRLVRANEIVHVCLPYGWFDVPESSIEEVADALQRKLREYTLKTSIKAAR